MHSTPKKTEHGVQIGDVEFLWARNSKDFFFSNSILIRDPQATLVDPSANFSYLEFLASQNKVQQVLNTHYHVDHRSLNSLFRNAKFMCHPLDRKPLMSTEAYLSDVDEAIDPTYTQWLKAIFASLGIGKAYFSILLEDGDRLPLEAQEVEVVHLPGHTPGHIGLLFKEIDLLYVSDVDLTPLGPWYANRSSNIEAFLNSLARIRKTNCRYYVTSHGGRVYEPEQFFEKLTRFETAFTKRESKLLEALAKKPARVSELAELGIIYKKSQIKKDPLKAAFEKQMLGKHLQRLEKQNQVFQDKKVWHIR